MDCDDDDAGVYPGAWDAWYDGVDADCAGNSDYDADGDGMDAEGYERPRGNDCDDTDATMSGWDHDLDGTTSCDGDCDDDDASIHPNAYRLCGDGIDNDCDGVNDCEFIGELWLPDPLRASEIRSEATFDLGTRMARADMRGDGDDDLLVGTSRGTSTVFVFDPGSLPALTSEAAAYGSFAAWPSWTVGDVTADGVTDAVVLHTSGFGASTLLVHPGPLDGHREDADAPIALHPSTGSGGGVYATDLNGDGVDDVVAADSSGAEYGVWDRGGVVYGIDGPMPGEGGIEVVDHVLYGDREVPGALFSGQMPPNVDFTGDGHADLLVRDSIHEEAFVVEGQLVEGVQPIQGIGHVLNGVINGNIYPVGDVDEDGYEDLIAGLETITDSGILFGPFSGERDVTTTADVVVVGPTGGREGMAGDLNDDGYQDLVNFSYSEYRVVLGPIRAGRLEPETAPNAVIRPVDSLEDYMGGWVGLGDVDGDSIDDIAIGTMRDRAPESSVFLLFGSGVGW